MSRRPASFREADLCRALRAARKAGVKIRVEIEPGKLTVMQIDDDVSKKKVADDEVERWLGKHAHRG
jgi:hypothetical protein